MATGIRQRSLGFAMLLCALAAPPGVAAQAGSITGKVTDGAGGAPLEAARVLLTGTNRIETSGREGQYTFRNVAPGTYQLRVLRLGYRPDTGSVTVTGSEAATLDFAMEAAPVQLDEVVSTATGEQRKLEIGNAVSTINAAQVAELAPITEFANLISGRAAGVQVLKSSGTTGTGTRIRIRGSNSISLSNEPLYYLDGIRLESGSSSTTLNIGGFDDGSTENAGPSRINDIVPDDIEDIEIVKGPAAATLYGIQASNGVVRITTKHGTAGPPQWNLFTELGAVSDKNTYPLNFYGRDTTAATGADFDGFCSIQSELDGLCTQTSVQKYQALNNPATRPYKAGLRQSYGANVAGGSDQVTYFVSGTYENEIGPFRLPRIEEDSVRAVRGTVADNQLRPNALEKFGVRANVAASVSRTFDVDASLGFLSSNTRFIENDNSFLTVNGSGTASGNLPEVKSGWFYTPAELFAELADQAANGGHRLPQRRLSQERRIRVGREPAHSVGGGKQPELAGVPRPECLIHRQERLVDVVLDRPFDGLARLDVDLLTREAAQVADRVGPEARVAGAAELEEGKGEDQGVEGADRPQPLREVPAVEVDHHVAPVMVLDLDRDWNVPARRPIRPARHAMAGTSRQQQGGQEQRL